MTSIRQDKDFVEAVIDKYLLEASIEWIKSNLEPDEVFCKMDLESWAESNGYAKV